MVVDLTCPDCKTKRTQTISVALADFVAVCPCGKRMN